MRPNNQNGQNTRYNSHNDNSRHSKAAFVIDVVDDEQVDVSAKTIDYHSLQKITSKKSRHPLTRVHTVLEIDNQRTSVQMLVDSGATASFINPNKLPEQISTQINKFVKGEDEPNKLNLERMDLTIKSAMSNEQTKCAYGRFNITINDWNGQHDFIFADISEDAILGMDFLNEHNVAFDFGKNQVIIREYGQEYKINYLQTTPKTQIDKQQVVLKHPVIIEAESERLIELSVDKMEAFSTVIFEPNRLDEQDLNRGILWANSLNQVSFDKIITVSVINASDQDVKLEKGAIVGNVCMGEIISTVDASESNQELQEIDTSIAEKIDEMNINDQLSDQQKQKVKQLIKKFYYVFQWSEYDTGQTNLTEHEIRMNEAVPIKQKPYRLPQAAQEEIEKQVNTMLEKGIIEESRSPWSSPIILVKKKCAESKEQEYRFCIDFRKLNQLTIKDSYPLPRIDDAIDALGGSRYFSTLDLASGYWQIPLAASDREKTAFTANNKLYQFRVMPFGLCNAPSTFQRLMDTLLRGLSWKYCLVYLDDVIVFSNDFQSHMERLAQVLEKFGQANLKLKPSKCMFVMEKVSYLGFLITKDGLKPDVNKTRALSELIAPRDKDEVKSFLGMMGYYRRFIPDFSTTAASLFNLTKHKTTFQWTSETEEAFQKLKSQLISAPILIYPDFKNDFEIYTDASGVGIGAVLVQTVRDVMYPVAFASRQLNAHERNYSTSEREMLAIVWASRHFKSYIFGRHIKFHTDHKPLSTLAKSKEPTGRLYRLLLKLQELDYEIKYFPGAVNFTADLLSRLNGEQKAIELAINKIEIDVKMDWSEEQGKDRELAIIRLVTKNGNHDEFRELENYDYWIKNKDYLNLKNDVLYLKNHDNEQVIVVPQQCRNQICKIYHDSVAAGHLGFEKTYKSISARFYWPKMKSFIYDYCATCDLCQKFKSKNSSNTAPFFQVLCCKSDTRRDS